MELHQLYYFIAVAETGGFSRAAQRCNIAQPSLSQQIKKLEKELDLQLFDRLGRGTILTEAGQALLPRARRILAEMQAIEQGLGQEIESGQGQLSVGFIPTIAPFLLPSVLKTFTQTYPQAEVSVYEDFTEGLLDRLVRGRLDIGIMSLPLKHKLIVTEDICTENLLVATARHHDLLKGTSLKTTELEQYPFIALNEVHCLGEQVQSFCYQQDVNLEIVCYTSQLATVHQCIASGLGVSLVPQILAATDQSEQLRYHQLIDPAPCRKIVAASHAGRLRSFLAQQFVNLVRQEYESLIARIQVD